MALVTLTFDTAGAHPLVLPAGIDPDGFGGGHAVRLRIWSAGGRNGGNTGITGTGGGAGADWGEALVQLGDIPADTYTVYVGSSVALGDDHSYVDFSLNGGQFYQVGSGGAASGGFGGSADSGANATGDFVDYKNGGNGGDGSVATGGGGGEGAGPNSGAAPGTDGGLTGGGSGGSSGSGGGVGGAGADAGANNAQAGASPGGGAGGDSLNVSGITQLGGLGKIIVSYYTLLQDLSDITKIGHAA